MTESSANVVHLRGVLAAEPVVRTLPSGDVLEAFRVTVAREQPSRVKVDSIDCSATSRVARKALARAQPGQLLEVDGSLRRRFWRGAAGLGSRYEVEVHRIRVVRGSAERQTSKQ